MPMQRDRAPGVVSAASEQAPFVRAWGGFIMLRVYSSAALAALLLMTSSPATAQDANGVVINQFATRGPGGPNDDFIELFNAGIAPVSLAGWSIRSCFGSTTATFIAQGTIDGSFVLPPRRYFLLGGTAYSRAAPADAAFNQIPDLLTAAFNGRAGFQLLDATGAVRDGVGSPVSVAQPAGSHCREGVGRATTNTGSDDVAYFRRAVAGRPQDSDDNARDFPGAALPPTPRNLASPAAAAATPRPSVSLSTDVGTIDEAGGVATITATLAAAFSEPVTVGLRFAEFAGRGADYSVSDSSIAIAAGARSGSITVRASDDAVSEGDELIAVLLDTLDNAVPGPVDRLAITIRDDDTAPALDTPRIYRIQGAAHRSPLVGRAVTGVPGIVTAIAADGFYLQDPDGDGNPATADGVFVRSASAAGVMVGSRVAVSGTVREFRPGGLQGLNNLSVTEIVASSVAASVFPFVNGTVTPTVIGSGGRTPPAEIIDNDSAGNPEASSTTVFDPDEDGLDFLESLEGMLVTVGRARVIGPSDADGSLWVVGDNGSNATGNNARGGLSAVERSPGVVDLNPERLRLDSDLPGIAASLADVGDSIALLRGVVGYTRGSYAIRLTASPTITRNALPVDRARLVPGSGRLSLATYSLGQLGPADSARSARIAAQIVIGLGAPDLIQLNGIGDDSGDRDDGIVSAMATIQGLLNAIVSAGGPAYTAVQIDPADNADGGGRGSNRRMVQLYNPLRVSPNPGLFGTGTAGSPVALLSGPTIGPVTLNLSPALLRPEIPAHAGIGKPLVVGYRFNGRNLLLVGSHLSAALGDDSPTGLNQPPQAASDAQRRLQAATIHGFVRSALALDAQLRIVVLGDFNADDFRPPLRILRNGPLGAGDVEGNQPALINLGAQRVGDAAERYTQIVDGNARATDHILVSSELDTPGTELQYVHLNSEYAERAADRDALLASLPLGPNQPPVVRVSANPVVADEGSGVELFGDTSSDSDGVIRGYRWTQVAGPPAGTIAAEFTANAGIVAPSLDATSELRFRLTATDNDAGSGSAEVAVTVNARSGDFTPDPIAFTPISGVAPDSEQTSNEVIVSGIDSFANLSVSNGRYNINGGAFTDEPVQVFGGERIRLRLRASTRFSATVVATLNLSGTSADFAVRTRDGSTVPSPFSFPATTDAEPGAAAISDSVIVTGLESPAAISVAGGQYSINGGPFTAAAGTVADLDAVRVQQIAANGFATTTVATLTIGGVSGDYRVTSRAADTRPDAFAFAPVVDAVPGAVVTSDAVGISGLEAAAPIGVSGGLYSINGGPFTDALIGTVNEGDQVRVQLTAATQFSATRVATLDIGGVAGSFSVTTRAPADTTPDAFAFAPATDVPLNTPVISAAITVTGINAPTPISISGGQYSINAAAFGGSAALVDAGDRVRVQLTSAGQPASTVFATLNIGGVMARFEVTTRDADDTPGVFSFPPVTDAEPGSQQTSAAITVTDLVGPAPISVSGGLYAIDGGPFTASAGSVGNGSTIQVRVTAAAGFATPVAATLSIGVQSAAFSVTTRAGDAIPDAFSLAAIDNVEPGALATSAAIAVTGIEVPVAIAITDGLYAVNDGPFIGSAGLVASGDRVQVRTTAANAPATTRVAVLSIGGVTAPFSVTTRAADRTPNAFSFTAVGNAEPLAVVGSGSIVVAGIEAPTAVSVINGQYSVNGGAFTAAAGQVVNGDSLRLRQTAAAAFATTTTTTLIIGGVNGDFRVTTRPADAVPDAFTIAPVLDAEPGAVMVSAALQVSGIETAVPIEIDGGRYSINGAAFSAARGQVGNGDAVRIEQLAAAGFGQTRVATLRIGGVAGSFSVTTRGADTSPDPFAFPARDDTVLLAEQISETIIVSGIEAAVPIAVSNGAYSINEAPFVTPVGTVTNGDRVRLRHVSANRPGTATVTTLTIADRSASFRTTTAAAVDPGPGPGPAPASGGGGALDPLWLLALLVLRRRRGTR
ncbi:MAG: hypothetical protein C0434_14950 [Xanthomonadaceae bacterium]|nr:hypothetical protein [Xanthomonadaceae bacterium]